MFWPALIKPMALVRSSRGTSDGTSDCCVGIRSANSDPFRNAAIGRCQGWTNPLMTSTASTVARKKAITWQASISRRRSMRSMSAPPKGATTRNGKPAEKVTMPTNPGELVMTMASQPSATCCIHCPTEDASAPSHRRRNTGCRATAPRKRACHAASTGLPRTASSNRARGLTRMPERHDFLQGNACPTIAASARAGNRADYTTGSRHQSGPPRDGLS